MTTQKRALSALMLGVVVFLPQAADAAVYAYYSSGSHIEVLNTETGVIEDNISVTPITNGGPTCLNHGETTLFVPHLSSMHVVDIVEHDIATTAPTMTFPRACAVSDGDRYVYVSTVHDFGQGFVFVYDTLFNTIVARERIPTNNPGSLTLLPDNSRIYVVSNDSNQVIVVDASVPPAVQLDEVIAVPDPELVLADPNGPYVYVATSDARLHRFETRSNAIAGTVSLSVRPFDMVLHPHATELYVVGADGAGTGIDVIDLATFTGTNTIDTTEFGTARGIDVDSTGDRLYVPFQSTAQMGIFSTASGAVESMISLLGDEPHFVRGEFIVER